MSTSTKDDPKPIQGEAGASPAATQQERSEKLGRQKVLGENLRSIFNGIADEAVPSSMLTLLDDLERKGAKK